MNLRIVAIDQNDDPGRLVEVVCEDIIEGTRRMMLHPGDVIGVPFAGRGATLNGAPIYWGPGR